MVRWSPVMLVEVVLPGPGGDSRWPEVRAEAERAIALEAEDPEAWRFLGQALLETGELEPARDALERVLSLDPERVVAWCLLGRLELEQGRIEAGGAAFGRAVELEPDDGDHWFNLACCHALVGRVDASLAALAAAIQRDDSNVECARQDADLDRLRADPRFRALVLSA